LKPVSLQFDLAERIFIEAQEVNDRTSCAFSCILVLLLNLLLIVAIVSRTPTKVLLIAKMGGFRSLEVLTCSKAQVRMRVKEFREVSQLA
jgi:hypothetical protein